MRSRSAALSSVSATISRAVRPIAAPSSYGRPTPSPFQNGTAPGMPGRRRDEHAVARDLLDPPGRGAEQERLARPRLVDHLLVQLADAAAAVHEVDAEEPAVGDRARVRDREPPRAFAPADDAAGAVPDDPRPQLGELLRRVAPGEHVEDVLELRPREVAERVGAANEVVELVDGDLLLGGRSATICCASTSSGLRGIRVSSIAPSSIRFATTAHSSRSARNLGKIRPFDGSSSRCPGAADALEPGRDRLRRFDLHDEVDGAHVDSELERRGRDEARDLARASGAPRPRPAARARASRGGRGRSRARRAR